MWISPPSGGASVPLTAVSKGEAAAALVALRTHKHRRPIPRSRMNLINMNRVGDMGFITLLAAGQRGTAAPENFGFNGQPIAAIQLFPLSGDFLLQRGKAFSHQAFPFDIGQV